MGLFGPLYGDNIATVSSSSPVFPVLTTATTASVIRDRIIAVIEGLTPSVVPGDKFHRYRNEGAADFEKWATANPTTALRRFQVRFSGDDRPPEVSNTDYEERVATFVAIIAYPQTSRTGPKNALDRDTAVSTDQHKIEHAIGMAGAQNFNPATDSSYPSASWRGGKTTRVQGGDGQPVDFLVIEQDMAFRRNMQP